MRAAPALTLVMLATLMLVPVHDAPQQTFQQQPLPKIAPSARILVDIAGWWPALRSRIFAARS